MGYNISLVIPLLFTNDGKYIGITIYSEGIPYYFADSWACPALSEKEGMLLVCLEKDFKEAKERLEKSLRENKFKTLRDKEKRQYVLEDINKFLTLINKIKGTNICVYYTRDFSIKYPIRMKNINKDSYEDSDEDSYEDGYEDSDEDSDEDIDIKFAEEFDGVDNKTKIKIRSIEMVDNFSNILKTISLVFGKDIIRGFRDYILSLHKNIGENNSTLPTRRANPMYNLMTIWFTIETAVSLKETS